MSGYDDAADSVFEEAVRAIRDAGAEVVDPANIPTLDGKRMGDSEMIVMQTEFKHGIAAYLATRIVVNAALAQPRSLADLIEFNKAHAEQELVHFGQEQFERSQESGPLDGEAYLEALAEGRRLAAVEGLDAVLDVHGLDALIAPTGGPAWPLDPEAGNAVHGGSSRFAAIAGYPLVTVPAGFVRQGIESGAGNDLPIGLTFMGRAWSEPTLIRLAFAFERITQVRRAPEI